MSHMEDQIRRIVTEFQRKELEEDLDAFFPSTTPELSTEIEDDLTADLDEFERQLEEGPEISVRDYVGPLSIRPLCEIPLEEMQDELDRIIEILYKRCVVIDFLYDIELSEAYRFVTEELMDEMMTDVRVPEMYTHFIYEDFHPNDIEDIKDAGEEFLSGFLGEQTGELWEYLVQDGVVDQTGTLLSLERIHQLIRNFHIVHDPVDPFDVATLSASVKGDEGTAVFHVTWYRADAHTDKMVKLFANVAMHFRRSPYGGWDIVQAALPFD